MMLAPPEQPLDVGELDLDVGLVELDDLGDEQELPRHPGLLQRGLQALVDEPLMGGVLIDDDEAVAGLRHDVGLVYLGASGAERLIETIGYGRREFRTNI